jgi:hypothetical protein
MPAVLTKSEIVTVSPLSPNTLRILVLVEASNRSQGISVNDLPPVIDLNPMAGIQSSSSVIANTAQITAGIAFNANFEDATDMDIKTIKVVLGGAGLNGVGITMSINIISNTAFGFSDACRLDKV